MGFADHGGRGGAVELEELIRDELTAVAVGKDQYVVEGPPLRLKREAAEALSLALHELTTNAVKYSALSEPAGRVAVTWRVMNTGKGPRLSLEWRETGVRAIDARPARSGFGRELIERGLPYELGAETSIEFRRGGIGEALLFLGFALLVLWRHRANLARLFAGTEPKVGAAKG